MVFSQSLNSRRIFKRPAKAQTSLRVCAGWSKALLVAHTTLLEISGHGSIMFKLMEHLYFGITFAGNVQYTCITVRKKANIRNRFCTLHAFNWVPKRLYPFNWAMQLYPLNWVPKQLNPFNWFSKRRYPPLTEFQSSSTPLTDFQSISTTLTEFLSSSTPLTEFQKCLYPL